MSIWDYFLPNRLKLWSKTPKSALDKIDFFLQLANTELMNMVQEVDKQASYEAHLRKEYNVGKNASLPEEAQRLLELRKEFSAEGPDVQEIKKSSQKIIIAFRGVANRVPIMIANINAVLERREEQRREERGFPVEPKTLTAALVYLEDEMQYDIQEMEEITVLIQTKPFPRDTLLTKLTKIKRSLDAVNDKILLLGVAREYFKERAD